MLDIIIIIVFCYLNGKLAKQKGLNNTTWVLITIAAIFGGMFIGSMFIALGYKGTMDMKSIQQFLFNNPLKILTFYAMEIGGGLLVRYVLDKKISIGKK
ncbi:hypothetical protein CAP35_10885 [Chitinophagaceae bacterium IBVUCB1]|nr:hypothetical protein CAP35_10885 [Chitinophagaceae bacterium IBVUCB1]